VCPVGKFQPEEGGAACVECKDSRNSSSGSAQCSVCAEGYYRPFANSSAAECTSCAALRGVSCASNATIETLRLAAGYWRHSTATRHTYLCKADGSWSPCVGGADAAADGDGYCADGYRGARCELCDGPAYSRFFEKLDARCHDCGDMPARSAVAVCVVLLLILLAAMSFSPAIIRRLKPLEACSRLLRWAGYLQIVWKDAGMRYKVKALVGFYQCVAAVPSVYSVQPPIGLEHLTEWIYLLELPSEFERVFVVPNACLGDYRTQIWVSSA
jgi:hypothetical protein